MTVQAPDPDPGQRSIPFEDIVAPLVFIIGTAVTAAILKRATGLGFWPSFLIAVVAFPGAAMAVLWLITRGRN